MSGMKRPLTLVKDTSSLSKTSTSTMNGVSRKGSKASSVAMDNSFTFESPKKASGLLSKSAHGISTDQQQEKKRKFESESTPKSTTSWKAKPTKKVKQSTVDDEDLPFSHKSIKPKSGRTKFVVGVTGGDFMAKNEINGILEKIKQSNSSSEYECVEFGGSDIEKYTHLVCLDEKQHQTLKLVYSVALNIPILKPGWIYESGKVGYFVSETEFYLPQFVRNKRPKDGVLHEKRFFILKGDAAFPDADICEKFITLCGGRVLDNINRANIIIATLNSKDYTENIIPRHDVTKKPYKPVVTMRWLVDTVEKQVLQDPEEYLDDYFYSGECVKREKEILGENGAKTAASLRLTTTLNCSTALIPLHLDTKTIILGRSSTDVDYVIDTENSKKTPVISRRHAKIVQVQENSSQSEEPVIRWKLIDSSSNGTFVNNTKVSEAFLVNGDIISFGHSKANIKVGEKVQYVNTKCTYVFETDEIVSNSDSEAIQKEKEELEKQNEQMRNEIQQLRDKHLTITKINSQMDKEITRLKGYLQTKANQKQEVMQFPYCHKYVIQLYQLF